MPLETIGHEFGCDFSRGRMADGFMAAMTYADQIFFLTMAILIVVAGICLFWGEQ